MTSYNVSNLIEMDSPQMSPQLQFQDFPEHQPSGSTKVNLNYNSEPSGSEPTMEFSGKSFWTFDFYKQFFDVNTSDVINRIKWSMLPQRGVNYLQTYIHSKPDLYGPFWISVTLIFTIAITGNLANFLQNAAAGGFHWKYDFHAVSFSATAIIIYAWILPLCIWSFLRWSDQDVEKVSLLELVCVYGYCLSIYVPISILWVIQVNWLQWLLVLIGAALSGLVLTSSIAQVFGNKKWPASALIMTFHFLLALCFMLYFFHVPPHLQPPSAVVVIPNTPAPSHPDNSTT